MRIPVDKPFIVLSGSDPNNTVITWNDHAGDSGMTFYSATVSVDASDFIAQFITFQVFGYDLDPIDNITCNNIVKGEIAY